MLAAALGKLRLPLKNDKKEILPHPFRGNLATKADGEVGDFEQATVHYSFSATHDEGTSFGGWAPWPERVDEAIQNFRSGMPVVTVEIPQYRNASKALNTLEGALADVLLTQFLGVQS
jgi:hypothetical protein